MVVEEYKNPKHTWLVVSLVLHGIFITAILVSLLDKNLNSRTTSSAPILFENEPLSKTISEQEKEQEKRKRKEQLNLFKKPAKLDEKPFTVPAPVVFYGNQTMMNLPTPIAGSPDGKSSFDSNPSTLPTPAATHISTEPVAPAAQTILPQDDAPIQIPENAPSESLPENKIVQDKIELPPVESVRFHTAVPQAAEQPSNIIPPFSEKKESPLLNHNSQPNLAKTIPTPSKQVKKQLTLAELFKNAPTALNALGTTGEPSARKAGTQGGDVNGSGHQITIKEGDMKYYTLWAKFLNHLNQAARFNRRGKEHRIHELVQTGAVTYILQCAITVDKEGKLVDIELANSSGSPEFDQLCISDIKSGIPYPPLPDSLGKKIARFEVNVYP